MKNLTSTQQTLLNRVLFGIGLGCLWTGNRVMKNDIKRFLDENCGNNLPKYMNREEWIRGGLHYFLIKFRQDVNYFRKTLPEVQMIQKYLDVALRLTGETIRMTETEVRSLLETL